MLKAIYILLVVPVYAATTVWCATIAAMMTQQAVGSLGGLAAGLFILILGILTIIEFVAVEAFNRSPMPWLSWLRLRSDLGDRGERLRVFILLGLIAAYLYFGARHS